MINGSLTSALSNPEQWGLRLTGGRVPHVKGASDDTCCCSGENGSPGQLKQLMFKEKLEI